MNIFVTIKSSFILFLFLLPHLLFASSASSFDGISLFSGANKNQDKTVVVRQRAISMPLSFSAYYSFVHGSFKDRALSEVSTSLSQNSPLSLGLGGVAQLSNRLRLKTDFSYTKYQNILTQGDDFSAAQELEVPIEYGLNTSLTYSPAKFMFDLIVGLDSLKISSLNTDGLLSSDTISIKKYSLNYIVAGLSYRFSLFDHRAFIFSTYGFSISSKEDGGVVAIKAEKYEVRVKVQAWKKVFGHVFYTYHNIVSSTQLSINRMGIGFGLSI